MVESIKKLREICQKPVIHLNTWYARNFARRISIYFTWLCILLRIKATPISLFMLFTGILGSFFFSFGTYSHYVLAVILLQFWYIFDHVDGELARYWKESDAKGIFLDKLDHHIVHPLIFLFLGIGLWKQFNDPLMLILGGFIAYLLLLQDLINIDKRDSLFLTKIIKSKKELKQKPNIFGLLFTKISAFVYKIPGLMNIITIAAVFNLIYYAFLFYAITFPMMILIKIVYNLNIPDNKFK